jgi:hypothetical protein
MAPAPGAVGSCGGENLDREADLVSYCKEREELMCVRQAERGELSDAERDECRRTEIARCDRRFWAPGCRPTQREANACLNALRSLDTLSIPEDELYECNRRALCTARPAGKTASIDGGLEGL